MRLTATLLFLVLFLTTLDASALERSCTPEDNAWLPGRYYDAGEIVFYDGRWWAAQEWQEGKRPDGGGFAWKPLEKAPDCKPPTRATVKGKKTGAAGNVGKSGKASGKSGALSEADCKPAPDWTFSGTYTVGQWVTYKGQIFKAIRPTTGDMPGVAEPPHWAPVNAHCPVDQ
ncbi:carbohydrate-binding protein [Marinobacter halodurans]|uniref:Carbohydrate-binding protein n=1 Tax=Marinobacter halodurans TaxID=2528979 RepID=A0ABY1ZMY2_9GAMM|nr:carbohydrate-binding protein [Marinobacter halodurans]TBW56406.1 carbohydrate-binding protein [Marinobacter halodurans]